MADKVKEGFVDIDLSREIEISGAKVKSVRMREPKVADQIAASKVSGNDAEQEVALIANLCDVSPAEIQSLSLRDYKKVQDAFLDFTV